MGNTVQSSAVTSVADSYNNNIRQIVIATGAVTTLAGSGLQGSADNVIGTLATFSGLNGITTDGTNLYVTEGFDNIIRKIVIATGVVTTLVGSGTLGVQDNSTGTYAIQPVDITSDGTNLYVVDISNSRIRKVQ